MKKQYKKPAVNRLGDAAELTQAGDVSPRDNIDIPNSAIPDPNDPGPGPGVS